MENTVRLKGVRRGNTYYAESRNKTGAAHVSTEKNAWQGHVNIRINEEMENEYLNDGVVVHKERGEFPMKAVRRGNACSAESRKRKEAAYVSTEKNVWHRHGNMGIIEEMENEQVVQEKVIKYMETIPQVQEKVVKYMENHLRTNFLQELRSYGRGLIAVANAGKDDNTSQFLFTLSSTSELQNKHTIFGEVTGESVYNMLKLEEVLADENDRLLYPPRLLKSIILNNPFADIIPRIIVPENEEVKDS
ncbi:Peptidyl-prolyl cis-trans isomerase CWC27 like protein [Eufriesea mexicana]|uniref:Peptidyl-prolyl cis-trans isomerase n=1 Tax=Eufriesea mexicana TaxID=516756 RepID=A0A310S3W3_9HYME|nr:Peptidyl-prolyl cis-trans isomerase CWC27 like protein [Eufriesea mexicana]